MRKRQSELRVPITGHEDDYALHLKEQFGNLIDLMAAMKNDESSKSYHLPALPEESIQVHKDLDRAMDMLQDASRLAVGAYYNGFKEEKGSDFETATIKKELYINGKKFDIDSYGNAITTMLNKIFDADK